MQVETIEDPESNVFHKAVVWRGPLALHARCDHSGLAFDLGGLTLPDDPVAHFEAEGLFLPGVHA